MQTINVILEREAISFVKKNRPKESILFTQRSGKPVAIWLYWGEVGELFTLTSIRNKKYPYYLKTEPVKLAYYDLLASTLSAQLGAM